MKRRGFVSVVIVVVLAGLALVGGILYFIRQNKPGSTPSTPMHQATSTITTSTTTIAPAASPSAATCEVNADDFAVPPLPTSSVAWTLLTQANATSVYVLPPSFSPSTGEFLYPDAVSMWPSHKVLLPGKMWFVPEGDFGSVDSSYYMPILKKNDWSKRIDIGGYELDGVDAGGFHGIGDGYIKVENGYFRSVVVYWLTGAPYPTNLLVYVSDIVPLSEIVPGYKPSCPDISSTQPAAFFKPSVTQVGAFTIVAQCNAIATNEVASVREIDILKNGFLVQAIPTNGIAPGSHTCPTLRSQDINFDGNPDFMIDGDYGTGGTSVFYWIYNTSTQQFYCPGGTSLRGSYFNCSLMNPSFDPASKTISAWDRLGASDRVSLIYKVNGDSIYVYQETETDYSGTTPLTTVKQLVNGKMMVVSTSTASTGN